MILRSLHFPFGHGIAVASSTKFDNAISLMKSAEIMNMRSGLKVLTLRPVRLQGTRILISTTTFAALLPLAILMILSSIPMMIVSFSRFAPMMALPDG